MITVETWFLAYSNLFFVIPSVRAFLDDDWFRGSIFLFTSFFSFTYHLCDPYKYASIGACIFTIHMHHDLDFFFSQLLIPVIVTIFIYWQSKWLEYTFIVVFGIAIGFTLHVQNILYIIIAISVAVLLLYWTVHILRNKDIVHYKEYNVVIGLVLIGCGVVLFTVDMNDYYYVLHSLWHILIAYGAFFLLHVKKT